MTGRTAETRHGPRYGLLMAGALLFASGAQAIRFANHEYEAIRDGVGIGAAPAIGLAALLAALLGAILLIRAVVPGRVPAPRPAGASPLAPAVATLTGLALGVTACLALTLASAARFVEGGAALTSTGTATGVFCAVLAAVFGLAAPWVRGLSLGRIPLHFLTGLAVVWLAVRLSGTDVRDWALLHALV